MLRWKKYSVGRTLFIASLLLGGLWVFRPNLEDKTTPYPIRKPAGKSIDSFSPEQINKAEWSVSSLDFETSNPYRGRSYFDSVFSKTNGKTRVYNIPYPFQKVMDRMNTYLGYSGTTDVDNAVKTALFPMGRSLQRNAAQDEGKPTDINLYFRFPRVVVGIDREPKDIQNPLALNLKGRLFLGFHEKSKVIEVISYNDLEGRYEYQVVQDYEAGKVPKVVYADRQKCLGCHQNQTPIFSVGPWQESNAHLTNFSVIEKQMVGAFGDVACDGTRTQPYCFTGPAANKRYHYFGAPTRVDQSVLNTLDTLTDQGNYDHAFQKMWLNLCQSEECQKKTTKSILIYLLNGREGVYLPGNEREKYLLAFEAQFRQRFPYGMKIPDANILNRNPLQDRKKTQAEIEASMKHVDGLIHAGLQELISRSAVSGEFEPLMIRPPAELWESTEPDVKNRNSMLSGFADFFTAQDARMIDAWLVSQAASGKVQSLQIQGKCQIQKSTVAGGMDVQVACDPTDKSSLALEMGYFPIRGNQVQNGLLENLFLYGADANCDWQAIQSDDNRVNGVACPTITQSEVRGNVSGDVLTLQLYHAKSGLNTRLIDGRLVAKVQINLVSGQLQVTILNDVALLDSAIAANVSTKKPTPFSRLSVMKNLASHLNIKVPDPDAGIETLEKTVEDDVYTPEQILASYKNPVNGFVHSCGKCHYNAEGVPPAFLGLKTASVDLVGKCQRIEMCAPRMLYRLKMRNCSPAQIAKFKKVPMPLENLFTLPGMKEKWQATVAPQLIQFATKLVRPTEVVNYMVTQGVDKAVAQATVKELTQSDCPNVDYQIYENLPRCEFANLKADSNCSSLMSAFGNN